MVAVLGPLCFFLVLWLSFFIAGGAFSGGPSGRGFGGDFAVYVTAARVVEAGGDPYVRGVLYQGERSYLQKRHLPVARHPEAVQLGHPPLFAWAMRPFTGLPYQPADLGWMLGIYLLSSLSFWALLVLFGWSVCAVPLLLFMAMPPVVLGAYSGNTTPLFFSAMCLALASARRYPLLSGVIASAAWLKPQVGFPVILLIFLFHSPMRARFASAVGIATAGLLILTMLTTGLHEVASWVHNLVSFSRDASIQREMPSLAGLYVGWAPYGLRSAFVLVILVSVAVATAILAWKLWTVRQVPLLSVAWLWFAWFLATPYVHYYDEVLLTIPMLALLGRDGRNLDRGLSVTGLYLLVLSPLLIVQSPFNVDLICLPVVATLVCLLVAARTWESQPELATHGIAGSV